MKNIIYYLIIIIPFICSAHPKESYTWIMAPNYGIQFFQNQDITTFRLDTLKFHDYNENREHFSVISDSNGILKYYTSGNFVFDINSDIIPNTYQLNYANTYSWISMIVPEPINLTDFYYLNSKGNGIVGTIYEQYFGIRELMSEKAIDKWFADTINTDFNSIFTCVRNKNTHNIWLLTTSGSFIFTHKITENGLEKRVVKKQSIIQKPNHFRVSPNGRKILSLSKAGAAPNLELFDFNSMIGEITKKQTITIDYPDAGNGYGFAQSADFSYDSRYVYVYQAKALFLIDTEDNNTIYQIDMSQYVNDNVYDLSIAPDGRIYIAYYESGIYRINSTPEEIKNNVINLQKICEYHFNNMNHPNNYRFPKFMNDCFDFHIEFTVANPCDVGAGTSLSAYKSNIPAGSSWHWTCPDGSTSHNLILSEAEVLEHGSGKYYFEANNGFVNLKDSINLTDNQPLTVSITSDKNYLCPGEELKLKAASTGRIQSYYWSTGSEAPEIVITQPGKYSVEVKDKFNCAKTAVIEIINAGDIMDIISETVKINSFPFEESQNIDLEVKNTLNQPIGIESIHFINNNFMEVVDFPVQLEAKESKKINLKISPKQYGSLTDTIVIKYKNDCNLDERALFIADIYLKTKIVGYSINATTNQNIEMPIYAVPIGAYQGSKPEHFSCILRIDTSYFKFSSCTQTLESNTFKNGLQELKISGTIARLNLNDPLFTINGITTNTSGSSKIEILKLEWDYTYLTVDSLKSPVLYITATSISDCFINEQFKYENGQLYVLSSELQSKVIRIYDVLGCLVYENTISSNSTIDVSYLQTGVYFLKYGNQTGKFIKK